VAWFRTCWGLAAGFCGLSCAAENGTLCLCKHRCLNPGCFTKTINHQPGAAYKGPSANYGQPNDLLAGKKIGGVNVFGGGLLAPTP
jgi:hypothetical protein